MLNSAEIMSAMKLEDTDMNMERGNVEQSAFDLEEDA